MRTFYPSSYVAVSARWREHARPSGEAENIAKTLGHVPQTASAKADAFRRLLAASGR